MSPYLICHTVSAIMVGIVILLVYSIINFMYSSNHVSYIMVFKDFVTPIQ